MSRIDERIVKMMFDNGDFERGIKTSLSSLNSLKKGLKLEGATKGLADVSAASKHFSLGTMAQSIDGIKSKFSTLSVVGIAALATVASQAAAAGLQIVQSFFEPIKSGLSEYETNLNSVQTIMANTAHQGTTLKQVNAALKELNEYSDKTIYNFAEMARNIGTFTAAGVDLDTSVAAIKGIANLAAVSGSSSEQASTAMYQLSQALAAGKVTLMDWNSVVNAGMGGKVFQDALIETAKTHGVAVDAIIKKEGSFRDSISKGWLSSEILTETLSKFTGDLSVAQLKTMGYNDKQIAGIIKMGKTAQDAATKVKTVSQLIGTLKEAAGSGWSETWQLLFGDFEEAKVLFTNVNTVLSGFISASADARNEVLGEWKKLGGRTVIIDAIANAFNGLISVLKPIREAFRTIFPPTTGKMLYDLSVSIRDFTKGLKIGADTADKVKRTFAGVFALLDIGRIVLVESAKLLLRLFGAATEGEGSFLDTTASIGDFIVKVRDALVEGDLLAKIFEKIGDVLVLPIKYIRQFAHALWSIFDVDVDFEGMGRGLEGVISRLSNLGEVGDLASEAWGYLIDNLGSIWRGFVSLAGKIADASGEVGEAFASALQGLDFDKIISMINTGLFASLVASLRKFIKGFGGAAESGVGIVDTIKNSFKSVTETLTTMQDTLRAATLLEIAIALGIMTASILALSKVDAKGLTKALTAMTVMFTQLFGSMMIFEKFGGFAGFAKMPTVAAGMILLAIAINILARAVKTLSGLDWEELAKGLTGVTVLIGALSGATKLMAGNSAGMVASGIGLVILATAIRILVKAVTGLSGLDWEELAKGLVGVGTLIGALGLFTKFAAANAGGIAQGAGLVLLGAAIKILASAVEDFSKFKWEELGKGLASISGILLAVGVFSNTVGNPASLIASGAALVLIGASMMLLSRSVKEFAKLEWEEIGKGLATMAGALLSVALALAIMPPTSLVSAAAIAVVAASLGMIAEVIEQLSGLNWDEITRGLVTLGASLLIISSAMFAMTTALPGAAALIIIAGALSLLAPVLKTFGGMSWEAIAKGLLTLAGAFLIIGVAGLVLAPIIPAIIGLGAAITLLGVGLLAAGAGVLAFSIGLTALAASGAAATAAIVGIVSGLIGLIPMVMKQLGLGLIAFAEVIATSGPAVTKALVVFLRAFINAITELTPLIVKSLLSLIEMLLKEMADAVPRMIQSGMKMLIGILKGIRDNIYQVTAVSLQIVARYLDGIAAGLPQVVDSGVKLVISFVNAVADAIDNNSAAMGAAGAKLGIAMVKGMAKSVSAGLAQITSAAKDAASGAIDAAKKRLDAHSPSKEFEKIGKFVIDGFVKGLRGNKEDIREAFTDLTSMLKDAMKSASADVTDAQNTLAKLNKEVKKNPEAIKKARAELALARNELKLTSNAYKILTRQYADDERRLESLATKYDGLTTRIKTAEDALESAKKTRNDYYTSIKEQYSDLPEISETNSLSTYVTDLKKQVADVKEFSDILQSLRKLGLSDTLYEEILSKGTTALPFVKELLTKGSGAVNELNTLSNSLSSSSAKLASNASKQLYQAGVDSAAGLVNGLRSQQNKINSTMASIARQMVAAMKKALGIKSPAKAFAKVGEYSAEGMAGGLKASASIVEKSAADVGQSAILAMRKSISNLPDILSSNMDLTPTITPVLDLTNVQQGVNKLGSIFDPAPIDINAAYISAQDANDAYNDNKASQGTSDTLGETKTVEFIQNNYSPKALSEVEIYRQTRNQLSKAKGVL